MKKSAGMLATIGRRSAATLVLLLAGSWLFAADAGAQSASFEPLQYARQTSALLEHDGLVIGGVQGGGLVFWSAADPAQFERIMAGPDLSGNDVADLAWTGRHVWVATRGGGLTRITDPAGVRHFRQYASNLGSLNLTAVTGVLVGQSERVYYGMDGRGVGLITDGLAGAVYTREQDGLVSNAVRTLQVHDGALFIGTTAGISRFANNIFTTVNAGLGSLAINDLALEADGNLLAATGTGVYRWSATGSSWSQVGADSTPVLEISCSDGLIYTRGATVRVFNGTSWVTLSAPAGLTGAIHAGQEFWLGGQLGANAGGQFALRHAYVARLSGTTTFTVYPVSASQVLNASGVAFTGAVPHIGAQQWESIISSRVDGEWTHVRHEGSAPVNPNNRLSNGVLLGMASAPDGDVWAGLYAGTGLARVDAAAGITDLITPSNSGLLGRSIINVAVHPDGPVITMHDQEDAAKVEILVDPAAWASPGSWLSLPTTGGLGEGEDVWDAVVERRDVIWFAVSNVGVVRWDINGDLAGPNDPLTWLDQSDDRWDAPLAAIDGSTLDLGAAFGLEVATDGSLWVGGNGLVQFSYDETTRRATLLTSLGEKTSPQLEGLVNSSVSDIGRDANGHIWAATATGVNRVRGSGADAKVDTYLDLANYFANPTYGVLYSPNVITGLPGRTYRRLAVSGDRRQVLISADQGASLITVGSAGDTGPAATSPIYLFPNPFRPDAAGSGLKLGGLPDGTVAAVEIYNLEGQLVYRDEAVTGETGFWPGINRIGTEVSTGLYVVRVAVDGVVNALTLAVVK